MEYEGKYLIHHGPGMRPDSEHAEQIRVRALNDSDAYQKFMRKAFNEAIEYTPDAEGRLYFDITSFVQHETGRKIELTDTEKHCEINKLLRILTSS